MVLQSQGKSQSESITGMQLSNNFNPIRGGSWELLHTTWCNSMKLLGRTFEFFPWYWPGHLKHLHNGLCLLIIASNWLVIDQATLVNQSSHPQRVSVLCRNMKVFLPIPGSLLAASSLSLPIQGTYHPEVLLFFSQRTFWNFPFSYQLAVSFCSPTLTYPLINVNSLWHGKILLTSPTKPLKHRGSHQIQERLKHQYNINPAQTHYLNSQATPEPQESQSGWLKSCVPRYKYREIRSVLVLLKLCPLSFIESVVGKKSLKGHRKGFRLVVDKAFWFFLLSSWNGAWLLSIHINLFTIVALPRPSAALPSMLIVCTFSTSSCCDFSKSFYSAPNYIIIKLRLSICILLYVIMSSLCLSLIALLFSCLLHSYPTSWPWIMP